MYHLKVEIKIFKFGLNELEQYFSMLEWYFSVTSLLGLFYFLNDNLW
jgi:hypothetical protein